MLSVLFTGIPQLAAVCPDRLRSRIWPFSSQRKEIFSQRAETFLGTLRPFLLIYVSLPDESSIYVKTLAIGDCGIDWLFIATGGEGCHLFVYVTCIDLHSPFWGPFFEKNRCFCDMTYAVTVLENCCVVGKCTNKYYLYRTFEELTKSNFRYFRTEKRKDP